jgi:hypothetical protein
MRQTNQASVCWPRSIVDGRRRRPEGARANEQYRVIFGFANGNADEVRIVDYH